MRASFFRLVRLSSLRHAWGPALCVCMLFYLGFHAISGEHGLLALFRERRALEQRKAELAEMQTRREALEQKVRRLSDQSLDLDMLDEQAKQVIGYAGKDELVVFTVPQP